MVTLVSNTQLLTDMIPVSASVGRFVGATLLDDTFVEMNGIVYEDTFSYHVKSLGTEYAIVVSGFGFVVENDALVGGTINRLSDQNVTSDRDYWRIEGLNLDAKAFFDALLSDNPLDEGFLIDGAFQSHDTIMLSRYGDTFFAGDGDDVIYGRKGDDLLYGEAGDDKFHGGMGRDRMEGGDGADAFHYAFVAESFGKKGDLLFDFSAEEGDHLDLAAIDADDGKRNDQAFTYIADASFGRNAGELRFAAGVLLGDTDGDGRADFRVRLNGVSALSVEHLDL